WWHTPLCHAPRLEQRRSRRPHRPTHASVPTTRRADALRPAFVRQHVARGAVSDLRPERRGSPQLPARYAALSRLGQGGAGEVWEVRDRYTERRYALKLLCGDASEGASASLVKEAVALSGLEGLGVPRVISFGKL